jgi:hypothetical protein
MWTQQKQQQLQSAGILAQYAPNGDLYVVYVYNFIVIRIRNASVPHCQLRNISDSTNYC